MSKRMQLSKHYLIDLKESKCVKLVKKYLILVLHKVIMCITWHLKWEEYIPSYLEENKHLPIKVESYKYIQPIKFGIYI